MSESDPVAVALAYRNELASRANEIEARRQVPQDIADRLAEDGLALLCNPRDYGGLARSPRAYAEVVEALALGDASVAWCIFISITSGHAMASGRTESLKTLLSEPGTITAGVFAPTGRAVAAAQDGMQGYIVTGHWAWGSGSRNAQWVSGGCLISDESGEILLAEDGKPIHLTVIMKASDLAFLDNWKVMGLQGTGSTDFMVTDIFVPMERTIRSFGSDPSGEPIFQFPPFGMLALGIAAVALGTARGAMDDFINVAVKKVPQGARVALADKPAAQRDVAQAEAAIRQGRSFLFEAIDDAWSGALAGAVTVEHRRTVRLATTSAVQAAKVAVDLIHELAGGTSVYLKSSIQRRFRDIHVITQHMMVNKWTFELTGRLLLQRPTDITQL